MGVGDTQQWLELPGYTMGISARPAGPGRERRRLCSSGARAGQRETQTVGVSPLQAPGSDLPQEPEDSNTISSPPKQRALCSKSPISFSKSGITARLFLSKPCYTEPAPTLCLCTCCSLYLECSSPRFLHGWLLLSYLDLSSNVSSSLSHYLSYFLFNIYQYLNFLT